MRWRMASTIDQSQQCQSLQSLAAQGHRASPQKLAQLQADRNFEQVDARCVFASVVSSFQWNPTAVLVCWKFEPKRSAISKKFGACSAYLEGVGQFPMFVEVDVGTD
jgi:hypothetical protein